MAHPSPAANRRELLVPPATHRFGRRMRGALAALATAGAALAACGLPARPAAAQAITLPTVRIGGPVQEEREFFRRFQAVARWAAPDTAALDRALAQLTRPTEPAVGADSLARVRRARARADTLARRFGPALDSILLAALDGDQPDALDRAGSRADTLWALAYGKYDTTDVEVHLLFGAVSRYAAHPPPAAARRNGRLIAPTIEERRPGRLLRGVRGLDGLTPAQIEDVDVLTQLAVALIVFRKLDERDGWFPVHDRAQAEVFWGQRGFAPLNVGTVAASPAGGVAYTELAAPILRAFRLSLSAVIAPTRRDSSAGLTGEALDRARDRSREASLQQFLTGGGLVNLAGAWPLTHHGPRLGDEVALTSLLVPRLGFTAPKLGSGQDTTTLVLDPGLELHGKVLDFAGAVGVTAQLRYGFAVGTPGWGRTLDLRRDRLSYATAAFGFAFARQYQLTFARMVAGPRALRKRQWTVGLTAVRLPQPGPGVLTGRDLRSGTD